MQLRIGALIIALVMAGATFADAEPGKGIGKATSEEMQELRDQKKADVELSAGKDGKAAKDETNEEEAEEAAAVVEE